MRSATLAALILLLPLGAHADVCEAPTSFEDLQAQIAQAEQASAERAHLFETEVLEVQATVECLTDRVTSMSAARIHALVGASRAQKGDKGSARLAFSASRVSDARYEPGDWLSGEARDLYDGTKAPSVSTSEAHAPRSGVLRFDGRTTRHRPKKLPTIFQRVDREGRTANGAYLWPDDATPWYAR